MLLCLLSYICCVPVTVTVLTLMLLCTCDDAYFITVIGISVSEVVILLWLTIQLKHLLTIFHCLLFTAVIISLSATSIKDIMDPLCICSVIPFHHLIIGQNPEGRKMVVIVVDLVNIIIAMKRTVLGCQLS